MLNQYGGYLPNTTLDEFFLSGTTSTPLDIQGNSNGPSLQQGNYPTVWVPAPLCMQRSDPGGALLPASS